MVALERSEDHGLCPCCNIGWAITPDSVTVVLNIDGFTAHTSAGTLRGGPGSVRSTRSLKRGGD